MDQSLRNTALSQTVGHRFELKFEKFAKLGVKLDVIERPLYVQLMNLSLFRVISPKYKNGTKCGKILQSAS